MIRFQLFGLVCLTMACAAQAAVVVTSEASGEVTRQYFGGGEFLLMAGEQPAFGVDRAGNCWFVQHGHLVAEPCERMLQTVTSLREQATAALGVPGHALLQLLDQQVPAPVPRGAQTIAGYEAACYALGETREVCVSPGLLGEIRRELGARRFADMQALLERSVTRIGDWVPGSRTLAQLYARGYPMRDVQQVSAIPGLSPALLSFLPETQRARLLQQLGGTGGPHLQGSQVVSVERHAAMPRIDLSGYPRQSFSQFLQQSWPQLGGAVQRP